MVEFSEPALPERVNLNLPFNINDFTSGLPSGGNRPAVENGSHINHMESVPRMCESHDVSVRNGGSGGVEPSGARCSGCGDSITDRFYLFALERQWHNNCLRCSHCNKVLEHQGSCYVKDGLIYCKEDYSRRFGVQSCSKCNSRIQSGEMVMKAQSNVYHVNCFTCTICNSLLQTGDHFGIFENRIYCRTHFEQLQFNMLNMVPSLPSSSQCTSISTTTTTGSDYTAPCNVSQNNSVVSSPLSSTTNMIHENLTFLADGGFPPSINTPEFNARQPTSAPEQPTLKNRRKKRQNNDSSTRNDQQWPLGLTLMDESGFPGQPAVKQKRMRTSFKHHQLRIMKQYFNLNHNPDAKDLKQLSQKTGLSKRVLQVWFQNARAKYRRGLGTKDEGNAEGGDNSPSGEHNSNDDLMSDDESRDFTETDRGSNTSSHAGDQNIEPSPSKPDTEESSTLLNDTVPEIRPPSGIPTVDSAVMVS